MTSKVVVSFNQNAHPDYAGTDQTWEGVWFVDRSSSGHLMLNLKEGLDKPDNLLMLPWSGICKVVSTPEGDSLG